MNIAQRFYVTGVVQGVGFRAATRAQAQRLGLQGYARNLADGRVEVLAAGPEAAVKALHEWLHHGPRHAKVTSVTVESAAVHEAMGGFFTE